MNAPDITPLPVSVDDKPGDYQWLMDHYGISYSTARAWVAAGKVPVFYLAGSRKFPRFHKAAVKRALEGGEG